MIFIVIGLDEHFSKNVQHQRLRFIAHDLQVLWEIVKDTKTSDDVQTPPVKLVGLFLGLVLESSFSEVNIEIERVVGFPVARFLVDLFPQGPIVHHNVLLVVFVVKFPLVKGGPAMKHVVPVVTEFSALLVGFSPE